MEGSPRERRGGCPGVLDEDGHTHFAEQRAAPFYLPGVQAAGTSSVAQLMGHANVDTTLNVYKLVLDRSLREAVDKVDSELFTIVHKQKEEVLSVR
jgi:hypothetical protein